MSINPNLQPVTKQPFRGENEYFILTRNDVLYEVTSDIKTKYSGKGSLLLTSLRLFIIAKEKSDKFEAIEIPLSRINNETFNQPFFGKNYIQGNITYDKTMQLQLQGVEFKMWFTNKHCGTFVPAFFQLLDSLRQNQCRCHDENVERALQGGMFNAVFPIDPGDPSVFYISQPDILPPPNDARAQSAVVNNNNSEELKLSTVDVNEFVIVQGKSAVNQEHEGKGNMQEGEKNDNAGFEYKEPPKYNYIEPKSNFVFNDNNNNQQQGLVTADLDNNNNNNNNHHQFVYNNGNNSHIPNNLPPFPVVQNNPQQMVYGSNFNMPEQNNNDYNPYPSFNDNNY